MSADLPSAPTSRLQCPESKQQPIVDEARIVGTVGVHDHSADERAQVNQVMPPPLSSTVSEVCICTP
jgi:hypothetical protein